MRPIKLPLFITELHHEPEWFIRHIDDIHKKIANLQSADPEVSVIIPAYNEEGCILRTLSSLANTKSNLQIEIIVVDNNSSDRTAELVKLAGARYIFEGRQGVKYARTAGLTAAKGKYILNADADSVYSPYWVDIMTLPLIDERTACTYGRFAFFPDQNTSRVLYFIYESLGDIYKRIIQKLKDEAMYVYGCSSGYRKEQGIAVNGYEHPDGAHEDGYMGLKLRDRFGKLKRITDNRALVWTSDRRFNEEGGLAAAMVNRIRKAFQSL